MTRLRRRTLVAIAAVLFAVLLAGTAGALVRAPDARAGGGPARDVVPAANTTGHLHPDEGATGSGAYARADLDVANAIATSAERLTGRHDRLTVSERLYSVDAANPRSVATDHLGAVEDRLGAIHDARRQLLGRYANGTAAESTFTRRFALLQVAASQERALLDSLSLDLNAVDPDVGRALGNRVSNLRGDLATTESPVAERMAAALNGSQAGFTYYVAAGADAHVLAMAQGDELLREAYAGTNRNPDGRNQFAGAGASTLAAFNRAAELYPWTFSNAIRQSAKDFGTTHIYRIDVEHEQGRLTLFLDGATAGVFRELQTKTLGAVPVTPTANATSGGLSLTLNTTAPTGPMRVELEGARTGAPVNGSVRVGGTVVGTTGTDGVLWTVQPNGTTPVNATAGGDSVVVRPGQP